MAKTIETRVREILCMECGLDADEVEGSSRLGDDLGLDSLDCVELQMALEEEFGIEIADEDFDECETLQQLVAYVEKMKQH